MDWDQLLSEHRYDPTSRDGPASKHGSSPMSGFQEDANRIIHSTPFRRLQGKTQVHPFPTYDYLRTRLTHTSEVAHVGRVIATAALKDHIPNPGIVGDVVYAACLAHDLGNPPFGHIGEHAIHTWFQKLQETERFRPLFVDKRFSDFLNFDGNAQGFRILTRLTGWRGRGGLQLSYATLGAFSKYPYSSGYIQQTAKKKKKFGFLYQDKSAASKIYTALGMMAKEPKAHDTELAFERHPLAYIVEAADDICYLTTDIEDAGRMDLLDFDECEKLLRNIAEARRHMPRYNQIPKAKEYTQDRLKYLRAAAASAMIDAAIECFQERQGDILRGGFRQNLLDATNFAGSIKAIRDACEKTIYTERKKLQLEAAGFSIIIAIMDLYGLMLLQLVEGGEESLDMRERGLYQLLPRESPRHADGRRCLWGNVSPCRLRFRYVRPRHP